MFVCRIISRKNGEDKQSVSQLHASSDSMEMRVNVSEPCASRAVNAGKLGRGDVGHSGRKDAVGLY